MIDLKTAKPRAIEAHLREVIRKTHGDATENESQIYARNGYYTVILRFSKQKNVVFENFRRNEVPMIVKAIRSMQTK